MEAHKSGEEDRLSPHARAASARFPWARQATGLYLGWWLRQQGTKAHRTVRGCSSPDLRFLEWVDVALRALRSWSFLGHSILHGVKYGGVRPVMKWYHEGLQNPSSRFESWRACPGTSRYLVSGAVLYLTAYFNFVKLNSMKFFYVYVLYNKCRNFIYIGYSENLTKRIQEHSEGKVKSTKHYLPLKLIFYEAYPTKSDAKRREKYLKSNKGKTTLMTMLKSHFSMSQV